MDKKRIEKEMRELELKIHYHFNDISWFAKAMGSIKIEVAGQGKNGSEYANEGLATVGDTILKSVIADKLYRNDNIKTKGGITSAKSNLENNSTMHKMMLAEGLIAYSYNDLHFYKDANVPGHEKVVCKGHDPYVEAIVGAVYYDSNYDTTRSWILKWLLPLLKKYQQRN
ncbi:MAG: ribonuclease III domain-containing protein [Staphylococcus sp.]|nr:ribonuclease III domain-containing protein [Anaeroplasma bactoclasticum]MCM1196071.1 ribonuclease III domain-containing protein [Roseburia sp.]MCM1261059.1 ribonuclease III domain-containing protein [Staphylococcus sp.]MCM1557420.1 ribonuclease III domain-containing protein [Anaeroplasma bactoclasticum]